MTLACARVTATRYVDPRVNIHAAGNPQANRGELRCPTSRSSSSRPRRRPSSTATPRARRREEVRLGRGLRQGGAVRREGPQNELEELAKAQAWRAKKFDAGFGWITGPSGLRRPRARPAPTSGRWNAARGQYDVPNQGFFGIGLGMVAPTILAHGTDDGQGHVPEGAVPRRHRRLPAVQRARRRLATSPACRPRPSATATSGSSTARRCGRRARSTPTSARSSPAPTPTCPSTRASPASSSTCTRPASRCARCAR